MIPENLEWFNIKTWRPISSEQAINILGNQNSYFLSSCWPPSENSVIAEEDREHILERIQKFDGTNPVGILPPDDSFCIVLSPSGKLTIVGGEI